MLAYVCINVDNSVIYDFAEGDFADFLCTFTEVKYWMQ